MGTPIPDDPFVIDPAKDYDVTLDSWNWFPGPPRCGGSYVQLFSCQKTGQQIIDWLDAGHECSDVPLCAPEFADYGQRILSIVEV